MRSPSRLALAAASVAAFALLALFAVPYLFRDRIAARLKLEANRSVNARVDWGRVGLSLFRDFPNATLTLERLSVVGAQQFAGDTLVAVRRLRLALDVPSVLRYLRGGGRIVVREVDAERPALHLRVLGDGHANWDIQRAADDASRRSSRAVAVTLRKLALHHATVTLDNQQSGLAASMFGLEQSLSGDFARDKVVLESRTTADTVSLRFAGVPYLHSVRLELNADVAADLRARRFAFRNDSLRLNNLVLAFTGSAAVGAPNVALDLAFSAPSTAFAEILSLVPAIYAHDFARLRTSGKMSVAGRVRGEYGPTSFPALAIRARVEDGAFRYPELPLPARGIFADLSIDNRGGSADSTVVTLKRFHAVIGQQPLDGAFVMRTPVSDPDVDLRIDGTLDLADLRRTVKLTGVDDLSGVVNADVAVRARLSQLDAGRYEQVASRGSLNFARVAVKSANLGRPVAIDTAALRLTPRRAELTTFAGRIGRSDLRATGSLDNVLGYFLRDDVLRGQASVRSAFVDLNEWRSEDEMQAIPVPPNVDFAIQAAADRVAYDRVTATNVRGNVRVKNRRATLDGLRMDALGGSVVANGFYETLVPTLPTFDVDLRVVRMDVPSAFAALNTVQKLAPVARWAQGSVSGDVVLKGALGRDMTPAFEALTGRGSIESERLAFQGVPILAKLAESFALEHLRNPAFEALRATFEIVDGRVRVKPFDVRLGRTTMTVAGSNGIDQSLNYDLALAVPRADLDAASGRVVTRLAAQAGKAGLTLNPADVVALGAKVTGTITNPVIKPNFSGIAASAQEAVKYAARREVETHVATAKEKVDSAAEAARQRARAEADRIVQEAEARAQTIRDEARALAAKAKSEAGARADTLVARATSPAAQLAAKVAADRIRREADQQGDRLVREADARADALVAQAKQQADALLKTGT